MKRNRTALDDLPKLGIRVSNVTLLGWERARRFPARIYDENRKPCYRTTDLIEWLSERARKREAEAEQAVAVLRIASERNEND
jgi:hypothetical protein